MSYLIPGFIGNSGDISQTSPFPDPFCDYASTVMPTSVEHAFRWCEFIALSQGVYKSAIDRVIAYFITDIEIENASKENKEKYLDYLNNTLGIYPILKQVALDLIVYGNFFVSVVQPFRRSLRCPNKDCGFEAPLKRIHGNKNFNYQWRRMEFHADCPYCGYRGEWSHVDRRSHEEDKLIVKRWSPYEIELIWDPYTEQVSHIWKIPQHYKRYINQGTLFHLERAPWEVIQAVKHGTNIEFDDEVLYHGKEETLAGVLNKGLGVSRMLSNFKQAWYLQVLHRYNEAIGLDYIIPFRVITPAPRTGGSGGEMSDPLFTADLGGFTGQVNAMLANRRRDPTAWFTLPFPVQYQALGGDASQLAPYQLMQQAEDELLSAIGIPVQFYRGDMTVQAAPAALRLMESFWSYLTYLLNNLLQWLCNRISTALSWDEVSVKLTRPSYADDLNRQLAVLQLMLGGQISQTTGLRRGAGLDFAAEQRLMIEEQKFMAEESQEAQEQLEAAGLADQMASGAMGGPGGAAPGGMPPTGAMPEPGAGGQVPPAQPGAAAGAAPMGGGGGAPPTTPQQAAVPMDPVQAVMAQIPVGAEQGMTPPELDSIANTIAQQIYGLPPGLRQSALRQLKDRSTTIHALVKSILQSLDSQAEAQGRQMSQDAAMQGQQQSMAPPPMM